MKFSIIPLYFGKRAALYTIAIDGEPLNEYYRFLDNILCHNAEEARYLDEKLKNIANRHGIIPKDYKRESSEKYNVFRITDSNDIRLYCIMFSRVALVIGSGGMKIPGTSKNSENPHLEREINCLIEIEEIINDKIKNQDIQITNSRIEGDLEFEI